MKKSQIWTLSRLAVLVIVVIIFTPLVIPSGKSDPFLLGMPYTLWMGLLISFVLLGLTIIGSWVHPGRDH